MSYLIRRVLAKPRPILDEMCRLYGKFASYLRRVLFFPRINGPNISYVMTNYAKTYASTIYQSLYLMILPRSAASCSFSSLSIMTVAREYE